MGPGDQNLGTVAVGGIADVHHVDTEMLALLRNFAGDLLAGHQNGLGGLRAGADPQGDVVVPGINAGDHTGENFMLLGAEFVVNHAPLGLPQTLDDDLLAVSGGDAAKLHVVDRQIHNVADLVTGGDGVGFFQRHLVVGVYIVLFVHHVLLNEHLQIVMGLVHVHNDVFNALVVPLVGGGDGLDDLIQHKGLRNAALLFQQRQGLEDGRGIHTGGLFLLLLASHCSISP